MEQRIAIRTENLSKNFGAVQAVKNVSLSVPEGQMHAVIGPNGAGKTTFMDLIVNKTRPSAGKVFFFEKEITGMKPYKIAQMGLNKCFQISQLFPQLTCYENVQIALIQKNKKTFSLMPQKANYLREECERELARVGMAHLMDETAAFLSYGDQRRLEIAITLAMEPKVLFLDEPTAGVARAEGYAIMDMVRKLNLQDGYTILFIEHDMNIVFNYSDIISVMNHGELIASDTPENIKNNAFVKAAYLGGAQ
ncbi:MAG: ABC transporter ATP-binding protein [Clostridia bacterium]|jgi:branched-chain amino acid transport system ATP-binding protein|nr:ABC transporter ATP-binding protein [Clostridia bacterium]